MTITSKHKVVSNLLKKYMWTQKTKSDGTLVVTVCRKGKLGATSPVADLTITNACVDGAAKRLICLDVRIEVWGESVQTTAQVLKICDLLLHKYATNVSKVSF